MNPKERIIYDMLVNAAEHGDPCPANTLLAVAIGASSVSGPVKYIHGLTDKGLIQVKRSQRTRVVTITATGKSTAKPQDKLLARQHEASAQRRDRLADLVSEGYLLKDAAKLMGMSEARIWQVWREVKQGLGWQAA